MHLQQQGNRKRPCLLMTVPTRSTGLAAGADELATPQALLTWQRNRVASMPRAA